MTMLEKVARALCVFNGHDPDAKYINRAGKECSWAWWTEYTDEAKAALQPLLPPDEGTIEAMRSAYLVTTPEGLADTDMAAAFTAAIQQIQNNGEL